ncbi:2'-5' RNA ligase family protein [Lentzea sp. NBRC 105346]|uniref:2'-5' RNA ligase family protein n=1 Tax=Lentzea sp. NBRC 105346 TaxID=3032205 RepID=UPI00255540EC|nr:2'-5' RNA ligase family protein [Lentzea sp. NBRC 105346]
MVDQLKRRWPEDWTKLHVYFVPDPTEIKPLADAYRDVIEDLDCVARQPDEWLHSTVMVIDDIPARDVTAEQRAELANRLQQTLAELPAFTLSAGPAIAGRSTIALDLVPDRDFRNLVDRVRSAAAGVFGEDKVQYSNGRPHITLAYATGDGDSGVIAGRLRGATDLRATLTVDTVRLVDVLVDADLFQFRWEELAVIPLRG